MSSAEFDEWKARGLPVALIKDLFQPRCLYLFGGWWADMDYVLLNLKAPAPSCGSEWLLASEYERKKGGYAKSNAGVMRLKNELISINLGVMWVKRHCPLLQEAEHKARALWTGKRPRCPSKRTDLGYLDHQLLIQDTYARTNRAEVLHPH